MESRFSSITIRAGTIIEPLSLERVPGVSLSFPRHSRVDEMASLKSACLEKYVAGDAYLE